MTLDLLKATLSTGESDLLKLLSYLDRILSIHIFGKLHFSLLAEAFVLLR